MPGFPPFICLSSGVCSHLCHCKPPETQRAESDYECPGSISSQGALGGRDVNYMVLLELYLIHLSVLLPFIVLFCSFWGVLLFRKSFIVLLLNNTGETLHDPV